MTQETMLTTDQAANPTESGSVEQTAPAQADAPQQSPQAQQTDAQDTTPDADSKATEGAPETYEFVAPEGQKFDEQVIGEFSKVAKELNLSQAGAQKLLDHMGQTLIAKQERAMEAARSEWESLSKADKEFGGDALPQNLSIAKKAMDKFASPELRALLNETGLGNHPEVIRMFVKTGKSISEDTFVGDSRSGASSTARDPAAALYPSQA